MNQCGLFLSDATARLVPGHGQRMAGVEECHLFADVYNRMRLLGVALLEDFKKAGQTVATPPEDWSQSTPGHHMVIAPDGGRMVVWELPCTVFHNAEAAQVFWKGGFCWRAC